MLRSFFRPGIALMSRLSYARKFAVLWLMFLMAMVAVTSTLYSSLNKEIQTSRRELQGITLAMPITKTIQLLQQHRGLTASMLENRQRMSPAFWAKDKELTNAFAKLAEQLPQNLRASNDWRIIKGNWDHLRQEGCNWGADENFDAHTRLINQLLLFEVTVSGKYVLTLDPEIDTAYLIDTALNRLPLALEHLGQIRAYGAAALARRQVTDAERVKINTLAAQVNDEIGFIQSDLERASSYDPALRGSLSALVQQVSTLRQQVIDLVQTEIVFGTFKTSPETFFSATSAVIDRGYAQLHQSLLPLIRTLIEARIAQAEHALQLSVGLAILLFLASVYLSIGIYYATAGSIRTLAKSACAFAAGNVDERVHLHARDELAQVGESFNEMADGFSALLAARDQAGTRLRAVIDSSMDAIVQMDADGLISGWNRQAEMMFGWTAKTVVGRPLHETIIPPRYRDAHIHGMRAFLTGGDAPALNSRIEVVALRRDGHEFPVELSISSIRTGSRYEFNGFIRDISKKKESEELIWRQANFDMLTGLPNRFMFHDRLDQEIRKAARNGGTLALLFTDLDRFKDVNDALGHSMGDRLLVEAARRISACVREADTVARLGGDEFVVLLTDPDGLNRVEQVTGSILHTLAEPFQLGAKTAYVSASIGVALYPRDATDIEYLLTNADQAMYVAKKLGRNRASYFTQELQEAAETRRQTITDLHDALRARQFRVFYQPIMDLKTRRIYKAEALIRWEHPERGLINPGEFIPLAEETGLIVGIGDWVFREAARQAKRCRDLGHADFQISVNMSPVQFSASSDPCQAWRTFLQELGLPGSGVVVEITEGVLLDADAAVMNMLRQFRNGGIELSLDDFGTGYASLSYLHKLQIDYLKIDQSFVRQLAASAHDRVLCEAIIEMAHRLGLRVVAEGVETEAQRDWLAEQECDYIQGYLLAKPLPAEELEGLLDLRREEADVATQARLPVDQ